MNSMWTWSRGNFRCWLLWPGWTWAEYNFADVEAGVVDNVPYLQQTLWFGPIFWSCVYFHRPERRPRSRCGHGTTYWEGTRVPMSNTAKRLLKFARWLDGAPQPKVKLYWSADRPVERRNVIFTEAPRHQGRTMQMRYIDTAGPIV